MILTKMTLRLIVEKIARSNKKFITNNELKEDCRRLSLDYLTTIKYLIRNRHLTRVFRGIFYIYSIEERKIGTSEMTFYEILREALKIKGINNWYFGLETALKFNNLTHEYFTRDSVISDKLFRAKPMLIMGRKVKFYKLVPKMLSFGIIKNEFNYSDPEKTLLDLFYLKHYSKPSFEEIAEKLSKARLLRYAKNYGKKIILAVKGLK